MVRLSVTLAQGSGQRLTSLAHLALPRQDLPVIDLQVFLEAQSVDSVEVRNLCRNVAETLAQTGVLVVRDPRVSSADNASFIDMMEEYFRCATPRSTDSVAPGLKLAGACLLAANPTRRR